MRYFLSVFIQLVLALTQCEIADSEQMIVGKWQETRWEYEKGGSMLESIAIDDIRKHEAEVWDFKPNHTLYFYKNGQQIASGKWTLKSKGDIIRIRYSDGDEELYSIKSLRQNEMTIHYDIEMEVRGIAQITFTRQVEG